jgi:hypothetical protein
MPFSSGCEQTANRSDDGPSPSVCDEPFSESTTLQGGSGIMSVRDRLLQRHDSVFSVDSNYKDPSANDLSVLQGAALLTADCLGVGLLALPEDVKVLGKWIGLGFLILNLPVNLYGRERVFAFSRML